MLPIHVVHLSLYTAFDYFVPLNTKPKFKLVLTDVAKFAVHIFAAGHPRNL